MESIWQDMGKTSCARFCALPVYKKAGAFEMGQRCAFRWAEICVSFVAMLVSSLVLSEKEAP